MIDIVRNLLPQDTRAVEFPSAFGMFTMAILLAYGAISNTILINLHPVNFWVICTSLIGALQFLSLLQFPKHEALRTACNWVSGMFWIWVSTTEPLSIGSIVVFYLGFSNVMAFLINTTVLSETWKR